LEIGVVWAFAKVTVRVRRAHASVSTAPIGSTAHNSGERERQCEESVA
jgi:hypothetical protein